MANTYIHLPHSRSGEHNDGFWSDALKRHLETIPNKGIPIGGRVRMLDDERDDGTYEVPREGLDYWLRTRYVLQIDTKQSVKSVQDALEATGDFEINVVANNQPGQNPAWIFLSD